MNKPAKILNSSVTVNDAPENVILRGVDVNNEKMRDLKQAHLVVPMRMKESWQR